jgi:prepilin-type processing-associated H-X9-DG protein
MYTQDHDELLPFSWNVFNGKPGWWWTSVLFPYIRYGQAEEYNLNGFVGCPSATWPDRLAYAANPQLMFYVNGPFGYPTVTRPLASVEEPAEAVLFGDCAQVDAWRNGPVNFQPINRLLWLTPPEGASWSDLDRDARLEAWPPTDPAFGQIRYRHNGGANLVYLDGHVKWWRRGQVPREQLFPPPVITYERIGY